MEAVDRCPSGSPEKAGRSFGKPLFVPIDRTGDTAILTRPTGRGRRDSLYRRSSTLTVR
jgi:hypothetical protein